GSTEAEARALHDEFNELTQPEYSLHQLRRIVDADLSGYNLDGPFPRELIRVEGERGASSRFHVVLDIIERENPTIRQLLHRLAGARGHWVQAGTPEQIADNIQEWFDNG
ncbi:MAG: LLM class flavin-dependent oxidoreductase, partial [Mesorhizobium sp.]